MGIPGPILATYESQNLGVEPPKRGGNPKNNNFKIDPVDSKSGLIVSFDAYSFAVIILAIFLDNLWKSEKKLVGWLSVK